MTIIYHQKQFKNYCRLHAINNLLGNQAFTFQEFENICDEFDKKNKFDNGFSKNTYSFYNNGGNNNIFGYLLTKKYKIKMEPLDNNLDINQNLLGIICFNTQHTWCVKNIDNKLFLIDSLKSKPIEITKNYFNNKFLHFFIIKI